MESSKVTARHIKQVTSDPQVAQVNPMYHQCTDLPASHITRRSLFWNLDHPVTRMIQVTDKYLHTRTICRRKGLMSENVYKNKERCQNFAYSILYWKFPGSSNEISVQVLPQVWTLYKLMLSNRNRFLSSLGSQRPISYKEEQYMIVRSTYVATQKICLLLMSLFAFKSGYSHTQADCKKIPACHLTWSQTLHAG